MPKMDQQQRKPAREYESRPQQRADAAAVTSSYAEVSNQSSPRSTNRHLARATPSSLHQINSHTDLSETSEPVSRSLLLPEHPLLPLAGLDVDPHQILSPASQISLGPVHTPSPKCYPGFSPAVDIGTKAVFTAQHMVLLHNASTVPNLTGPNRNAIDIAVHHATTSPYLIDEILAFTAFHMATLYPGSAKNLQRLATELQTRALNSFARLTENVAHNDETTAVPRFLFCAILGRHVLADSLTYCHSDFNYFIDRLVEGIKLNSGVRAVCEPTREFLNNSELQPFMSIFRNAAEKIVSPGSECDPLRHLMDRSDLSEASIVSCRKAIKTLQWSFDVCHGLDEEEYPQAAAAYMVNLDAGFIDALHKHQPEALVILAYYGVLLHRCRGFEAFGNAGAPLVRTVAGRLSSYWQEALAWPLHVLETERNSQL